VSQSIQRLKADRRAAGAGAEGLTKKERLGMEREQAKLQASLGGIREMGGVPDLLFVIDVNKEDLAIAEAKKLGIPVVAVVDTNCAPDGVTHYIIPGNDDAARAIALYCDLASRAALDGMSAQMGAAGVDIGALEEAPAEEALAEAPRRPEPAVIQTVTGRAQAAPPAISHEGDSPWRSPLHGEGTARSDRRRHDGRQEGADRDRRRHGSRVDWLRTKGLAKAAKKADRTAAEGLVGVHVAGGRGVAVEVNSETDFVAKNADFQKLVRAITQAALAP
jgi:hypothetical protein